MERRNILNSLPEEYKPLSPWAYFGYQILFSIPIVGLIFLIVFSFSSKNINRRNFARSFFCIYVLIGIILTVIAILSVGFYSDVFSELRQIF